MKQRKIFLNKKNNRYCVVKLYKTKKEMQDAYKKASPKDANHFKVSGVHMAYVKLYIKKKGKTILSHETGTILLNLENCGAGVVGHEIMHSILWAHKHKRNKEQYPIVINNMKEEEEILHNFTYAIRQFYNWYWRVEKQIK